MSGFIEGENRFQSTLFPERVDDYVEEDSVVRVIDVFIDRLNISGLGFKAEPAETGRPGYHPRTMLMKFAHRMWCWRPRRANPSVLWSKEWRTPNGPLPLISFIRLS
jgi:hypothetical protein